MGKNIQDKANLIWEVATKLVGVYKPHEYGKVILPMTVLKRFDEILKREEYIWDEQTQEIYDIISSRNKRFYPMALKSMAKSIELGLKIDNDILECCRFESLDEANDFLQIYMKWYNSRPQYMLGGYSPVELWKKFYKR